ncbi:MAG: T9SS type A sorting domain-containing protein [Sphingobacteriia bacterium]|nr:T9SS type A sorting domain-containing protein [Sphingobacteriia bacterium]
MKSYNVRVLVFAILLNIAPLFLLGQSEWISPKLSGNNLNSILFMDTKNGVISGECGTIINTDDGGNTWSLNNKLTNRDINSLFISGTRIYFCDGDIFESYDKGSSWFKLSNPSKYRFTAVTSIDGTWYGLFTTITNERLIGTSDDLGRTWQTWTNNILPDDGRFVFESSLIGYYITSEGLWSTKDGAVTWRKTKTFSETQENPILTIQKFGHLNLFISNKSGGVPDVIGQYWRSSDNGNTWQLMYSGPNIATAVVFTNDDEGIVLTKTSDNSLLPRIMKTYNAGLTWSESIFMPFEANAVTSPTTAKFFLAGKAGLMFRSNDNLGNFTNLNRPDYLDITQVEMPGIRTFYMATASNGIYKSADKGNNWYLMKPNKEFTSISFRDSLSGVATNSVNPKQYSLTFDGGSTWFESTLPQSPQHGVTMTKEKVLLFTNQYDFYISTDLGSNWTSKSMPIPGNTLEIVNSDTLTLFASDDATGKLSIYYSTDRGSNWEKNSYTFGFPISVIAIYTLQNGRVCMIYKNKDQLKYIVATSDDRGTTWEDKLSVDYSTVLKYIKSNKNNVNITGLEGNTTVTYLSNNSGDNWEKSSYRINLGTYFSISNLNSEGKFFLFDDTRICLITGEQLTTGIPVSQTKTIYIQIYPNPAQNQIMVNMGEDAKSCFVRVEICNAMGSVVKAVDVVTVNGICKVDVTDLSNGVYALLLHDGQKTCSSKFLIMH